MKPAAARVLVVDDDEIFRRVLAGELQRLDLDVTSVGSGEAALAHLAESVPEIVLLDLRLPGMGGMDVLRAVRERSPATDVIMLTGHGSIDAAIEAMRMGAFDFIAKPCPLQELQVRIERALERQALRRRATLLERGLTPPDVGGSFIGSSAEFRRVRDLIERVAATDSSVLITGETGSGKEMAAKLIHARSPRRSRPFVVVECAALQENLLQSELFGHERGAFTGAERAKAGLFEVAHGGTIFLDEIGEVSQAMQVQLLRVLDTSTFRHVGGTTEVRVDVRVLAATNRDLSAMVGQRLFREDLYYRLSTIAVHLPPLRQRRGDVDLLATHIAGVLNDRFNWRKRLSPAALDELRRRTWPGNVRELFHVIEAAMIMCEGSEILPEHLSAVVGGGQAPSVPAANDAAMLTLEQMERRHIARAVEASLGHRGHAAKLLGISERNLYRKLKEYGLLR